MRRGVIIAVVDGLKSFPEAITTVFPKAHVQTYIMHLIRHSYTYCASKGRRSRRIGQEISPASPRSDDEHRSGSSAFLFIQRS